MFIVIHAQEQESQSEWLGLVRQNFQSAFLEPYSDNMNLLQCYLSAYDSFSPGHSMFDICKPLLSCRVLAWRVICTVICAIIFLNHFPVDAVFRTVTKYSSIKSTHF